MSMSDGEETASLLTTSSSATSAWPSPPRTAQGTTTSRWPILQSLQTTSCCHCLAVIYCVIFVVFVVVDTVHEIFSVTKIDYPTIQIGSATISLRHDNTTADGNITMFVANYPGEHNYISYKEFEIELFYNDGPAASKAIDIAPFRQVPKDETVIVAKAEVGVNPEEMHGVVDFHLNLRLLATRYRYDGLTWKNFMQMRRCNLTIEFPTGDARGTMIGGPTMCPVVLENDENLDYKY